MSTEAAARKTLLRSLRAAGAAAYAVESGATAPGFPDVAAQLPDVGTVLLELKRAEWPRRRNVVKLRVGVAQPPFWKTWHAAGGSVGLAARVGRCWYLANADALARECWHRRSGTVELDLDRWPRFGDGRGIDRDALVDALTTML